MDAATPDRRHLETPFQMTTGGVAYREFGAGPPLVLFHGGAGSWQHWVLNVDALAVRFRVIALDQPSYGDSQTIPWETDVPDYLALCFAALEEVTTGAPRVHLAGFSFGGFIASDMAVRLGPRLAALSMTGGAGYGKPLGRGFTLGSRRKMAEALGREPKAVELRAMHAENLAKLMIWDREKIDDWAIDMQVSNVARTRFDSRKLSWMDGTPDRLGSIKAPTFIVYGEHDAARIPPIPERFDRCRAAKPDVQTHIIPDCGHWAMYEAPATVNQLLLDFHGAAP
ncbi:MAG: alpha/beta hydrolase [Pseudomonadota bacterium]